MQEPNDNLLSQTDDVVRQTVPESPNDEIGTAQLKEARIFASNMSSGNEDVLHPREESKPDSPQASDPVNQLATTGPDLSRITPFSDLIRKANGAIESLSLGGYDAQVVSLLKNPGGTLKDPSGRVPLLSTGVHRSLVLPTGFKPFGSTEELFSSIADLLEKHVPLPKIERLLVTFWAMATWFADVMQLCPTLVVTGCGAAANLLLQTLVPVCRRPLLLAEPSTATLRALPLGELMPTLLMRSQQLNKQMTALLGDSTHPGYLVSTGKDFQQVYCPKCIYVGEDVDDQLKVSSSIRIHVGGNISRAFSLPPAGDVITDFQNRLLMYRLLSRDKVASSNFHVSSFRPEISAIAEALGSAIVDNVELRQGIVRLLQAQDEHARMEQSSGTIGTVLRALLFHCHQSDEERVFVREIASTANRIAIEEGEVVKLSNEKVGHVLKNLGLYTRRLGNAGRGLFLDKPTQVRTHRLSEAYDVLKTQAGCSFCPPPQSEGAEVVLQN